MNETAVAPVNREPLILTAPPISRALGTNAEMVGGAVSSVPVNVMAVPVVLIPLTVAILVEELDVVVNCVVHEVGVARFDVAKRRLFAFCILPKLAALKLYVKP